MLYYRPLRLLYNRQNVILQAVTFKGVIEREGGRGVCVGGRERWKEEGREAGKECGREGAGGDAPLVTTSSIDDPVSCAMKPMMEKITKPAKILVPQLRIGTMRASLVATT